MRTSFFASKKGDPVIHLFGAPNALALFMWGRDLAEYQIGVVLDDPPASVTEVQAVLTKIQHQLEGCDEPTCTGPAYHGQQ